MRSCLMVVGGLYILYSLKRREVNEKVTEVAKLLELDALLDRKPWPAIRWSTTKGGNGAFDCQRSRGFSVR